MGNDMRALPFALAFAAALSGCVSISDHDGLTPPPALYSSIRASVGVPTEPVVLADLREGRTDRSFHVKEWVWSGASADFVDMALESAAQSGGLKTITYADYELTSYLGFVTVFKLVAYGK